ncbi:MAG TPA: DUF6263 family protein [Vicinamibacterales bacterium]|nr:DUF6263 family protein [Vicinamibacterales bacterium]
MHSRFWTAAPIFIALAVAASPLAAVRQDVKLAYKWTAGETTRYRLLQQTSSTISGLPGGSPDVNVEQLTDQVFRTTVESVAPDGTTVLREVIESMRMNVESPMGKIAFDSSKKDIGSNNPAETAMANVFSALIGESFLVTLTPTGIVRNVEGFSRVMDNVLKKMPPGAAGPMFEGMKAGLNDEAIKNMFAQSFAQFPDRAVKPGDTWENKLSVPNPVLGGIVTTSTSTLASVDQAGGAQVAKIATKLKIERDPSAAPVAGPMGMKTDLQPSSGDGELLFDVSKGRVQRGTTHLTIPMTMSGTGPDGTAVTMQTNAKTTLTMELIEK